MAGYWQECVIRNLREGTEEVSGAGGVDFVAEAHGVGGEYKVQLFRKGRSQVQLGNVRTALRIFSPALAVPGLRWGT